MQWLTGRTGMERSGDGLYWRSQAPKPADVSLKTVFGDSSTFEGLRGCDSCHHIPPLVFDVEFSGDAAALRHGRPDRWKIRLCGTESFRVRLPVEKTIDSNHLHSSSS